MEHQAHAANYLYGMGVLEEKQRDEMLAEEAVMVGLMQDKQFEEAHKILKKLALYPGNMYSVFTGLGSSANLMKSKPPEETARFLKFVGTNEVHNYLHVGLHKFSFVNWNIHDQFNADAMSVNGSKLERVLSEGYKVLLHAGQFDPVVVHPGVTKAINNLNWEGAEEFKKAPRKIWRVEDDVAGYVKSSGPLTYAVVRNTGRNIMMDNPQWGYDLVQRFTSGKSFD
jgi:vitellogenic carboxypeptidase-like protein